MSSKDHAAIHISGSNVTGSAFATGKRAKASAVNASGDATAGVSAADAVAELRRQLGVLLNDDELDPNLAAAVDGALGQLGGMERELGRPAPDHSRLGVLMKRIREGVGDINAVSAAVTALGGAITVVLGL